MQWRFPHQWLGTGARQARPAASLRTWLCAMVVVALLPVASLLAWQVASGIRADQVQVEATLATAADAISLSVERELASSFDALTVLSQSELFQQERIGILGRLLHGRPRRDWDSMFVLDRDGSLLLDTGTQRSASPEAPRLRELHDRVVRTLQPAVATLAAKDQAGPRNIAIALPVLQNGRLRYVLGARMADAIWLRLAAGSGVPTGARTGLFDSDMRLLAASGTTGSPGSQLAPAVLGALGDHEARAYRSTGLDGVPVFAFWRRVASTGWIVGVALPAEPIDRSHRQAVIGALSTSGLSLLAGLVLAGLVARRITRPLPAMATMAPQAGKDEFLLMLSHELRNPIGAISAAVNVLGEAPPGSEIATEARAVISRQARNLSHLMNELLDVGSAIDGKVGRLRQPDLPAIEATSDPDTATLPPSRRRDVLVVEENDGVVSALRATLELDGHRVTTATGGIEGLQRLLELKPEVAIVDIGLRGLTGFELARHARAAGYSGRLVALSGDGAGRDAHEALVAGFDACLVKPVDRHRLRSTMSVDS